MANKDTESAFSRVLDETTQRHPTREPLLRALEEKLGRPVVSLFTSFDYPVSISDDDADILEGILRTTDLSQGLALMVSSPGGDGLAAERIVNLCRSYSGTDEYWAIVPGKAKSVATMVCFGASLVLMGPSSELGPVDPQLIRSEEGQRRQYSAYNIVKSYENLFEKAVRESGNLEPYLQQLANYDERDIEEYRTLIGLSEDISVRTLKTGMMQQLSEEDIRRRIEIFLAPERTKSHGRPIFQDEASKCGLNIKAVDPTEDLWEAVYDLYIRTNHLVSTRAAKCVESARDSWIVALEERS